MKYEGTIYRPPSEAYSLLVQVTVGCAWNRCTFCGMYKDKQFRIKTMEEIYEDLAEGARYADRIRRIFLCDGDALAVPTHTLEEILTEIRALYPGLEGVRAYASARDVLGKGAGDLARLQQLGLDMVYLGLESGSDRVLAQVDKGITKREMVACAQLLKQAGIRQSVSIISGLGGSELSREHILETADALNQMQPEYVGMLVLYSGNDSRLARDDDLRLPSQQQVVEEMYLLLEHLRLVDCYFSSAHASNYIPVHGHLPQDRERLLELVGGLRRKQ